MPGDPNRLANLVGVDSAVHNAISGEWNLFRSALNGTLPSPADVMRMALEIDRRYGLLQIVPRPPGSDIPPGADEESIKQLAMLFSEPLPEELVEWLQLCNGPCIGPGGVFGVAPASN